MERVKVTFFGAHRKISMERDWISLNWPPAIYERYEPHKCGSVSPHLRCKPMHNAMSLLQNTTQTNDAGNIRLRRTRRLSGQEENSRRGIYERTYTDGSPEDCRPSSPWIDERFRRDGCPEDGDTSGKFEGQAHDFERQEIAKKFEREARDAKMQALQVAALHKLSGVLGIMALTWATVVLLGGFVSDLSTWDFYLISVLLLVESFRLFIIQIFIKLVSRIFYRENRDPAEFKFNDEQPELVSRLNFLAQASSGGIAFVCLLVTFYRISIRGSSPFSSDNCSKHVVASLWIFYMIVILNFIIAILSAALHLFFRQRQRNNDMFQGGKLANSLTTFYDTIYRTAVEHGITEGGEVDLLDFAFDKIASDLRRNIRPLLVRDLNREMIIYMYENNGVVMACQYLKGDDLWKRIAAANLPGFWCQERKVDTKQELFWSLSDRVFGGGADADASLNSIESLARCWSRERDGRPHPFLVGISGRGNVLDTIVDLVLMETRSPLHFRVRAFEACCRDPRVREYLYRQVDPHSDQPVDATQICIYLYELIYKEVHGQERQERGKIIVKGVHGQERGKIAECCAKISKSNLARLCIKLAVVLTSEGKNVRIVASIYSASALMLLLQPCDNTRPLPAAEKLQEWIKARFIVEQPKEARRHSYYTKADLEAAEKVLVWLNLPELEWTSPSVKVRDMENGMQVLSSDEIKRIISDIRGSTARTTPRTLEHYHSEWLA